jgi:hypothetical protein
MSMEMKVSALLPMFCGRQNVMYFFDNGVRVDMNRLIICSHNFGQSVFREMPAYYQMTVGRKRETSKKRTY